MSFEPFKFKLNPPPTVSEPTRVKTQTPAAAAQPEKDQTNAAHLIRQISGMKDTAAYLQAAIVERFSATGVEVDLAAHPEISAALGRIYGTEEPPNIITVAMLSNMLDAEAAATQLEMGLGKDSSLQPNPLQVSDLNLVTTTVEGLLAANGQFQNQLPGLLRSLKADQLVFQNWQASLEQYPVLRVPGPVSPLQPPATLGQDLLPARSLDLHDNTLAFMSDWANRYSANYSSMYQFMAGVSSVDQTITSVINVYVEQPLQDIVRVAALLQGLKGLFHKNALRDSADILATFVYARMASDLGGLMFMMDRYVHMAVDPVKDAVAGLGHLMSTINKAVAIAGTVGHGGVPGLPVGNPCSQRPHAVNTANQAGKNFHLPLLDKIPQSLQVLGQHLNWATQAADRKNAKVQESLRKLLERKNKGLADKLDTMCSLQSLDTLISLAQGVVQEQQRGTNFSNPSPAQQLENLTQMLSSVRTGSGARFVIQDGQVLATPPFLPAPSPAVESTLRNGGLDRITPADLLQIKGSLRA